MGPGLWPRPFAGCQMLGSKEKVFYSWEVSVHVSFQSRKSRGERIRLGEASRGIHHEEGKTKCRTVMNVKNISCLW